MVESVAIWLLLGILLVAAGIALTYVPAIVLKRLQVRKLHDRIRGCLALTYDDGPDPKLTAELVKLLAHHGVKASFFMVGFRAERTPAMGDLLAQAGHELGCHTQQHRNAWRCMPWEAVHDVNEGYRSMRRWLPRGASYRPPFGKITTWSWLAAARHGARVSWWTCDGADTHPHLPDPDSVIREVVAANGGVVLLHSHDRGQERHDYVLRLTDLLLQEARRNSWHICTMKQLLDRDDPHAAGGDVSHALE